MFCAKNKFFILFFISVILLYLSYIGITPFFDRDEGYYVSVVMSMKEHGNLLPFYNNEYWLEKPVLLYWFMRFSTVIFGDTVFAMRLHASIAGILLISSSFFLINKIIKDSKISLIIVASMAFMPLLVLISRSAMIDSSLVLFTTLTLLCFFIATESNKESDRKWYYISWAFLGLTFFAKGPVGIAVILPSVFIYLIIQRIFFYVFKRANFFVGIIILLLVNSWYFFVFQRLGYDFWDKFFVQQVLHRSTESMVGGTSAFSSLGGIFFYIIVILLTCMPFIAFAFVGFIKSLKQKTKARETAFEKLALYSSIICIITIIMFSLSATKLPYYVLPIYPFLAILVGYFWYNFKFENYWDKTLKNTFWTIFSFTLFVFAIVGLIGPIVVYFGWDAISTAVRMDINPSEYALPLTMPTGLWLLPTLSLICIAIFFVFKMYYAKRDISKMIATTIVGGFSTSAVACMIFFNVISWLQAPSLIMTEKLKPMLSENAEIAEVSLVKPSLHYYLGVNKISDYAIRTPNTEANKKSGLESYTLIDNLSQIKYSDDNDFYLISRVGLGDYNNINNLYQLQSFGPYILFGNIGAKERWQ